MPRLRVTGPQIMEIADSLWDCKISVLGLPCICDTPESHSDDCVKLRKIANSVLVWHQRKKEIRKVSPTVPRMMPDLLAEALAVAPLEVVRAIVEAAKEKHGKTE